MKKIIHLLILFLYIFTVNSCNKVEEREISGVYEVDKITVKDKVETKPYTFLKLNPDYTFKLISDNKTQKDSISGSWKIKDLPIYIKISSPFEKETVIQFTYSGKQTEGRLRGTIIYFDYPNDFHGGRFQSMLYVKLREGKR